MRTAWMSSKSPTMSRIFSRPSSLRSASILTRSTICPACRPSIAWKKRRNRFATCSRELMKLTLAHDHKLPTGVLGLAITPDGSRAFAACADGALYAVDTESGKAETFEEKHQSFASGCMLLPDGRTLISGGYDGKLFWHDVETRRCTRRVQAHQFWNWQLALSPDGRHLATTTGQYLPGGWKYEPAAEVEPSVKVFDTLSGELVATFAHTPPVLSCAFSRDGKHLGGANMMGEVRIWEFHAGSATKPRAPGTPPCFPPPTAASCIRWTPRNASHTPGSRRMDSRSSFPAPMASRSGKTANGRRGGDCRFTVLRPSIPRPHRGRGSGWGRLV